MPTVQIDYPQRDAQILGLSLSRQATDLRYGLERLPTSRERALAITKLEECVMWGQKALDKVKED